MFNPRLETARQLLYHLKEELENSEALMKEVWERCSPAQRKDAERELVAVIRFLEGREAKLVAEQ